MRSARLTLTRSAHHLGMIANYKLGRVRVSHLPRAVWLEPTNHCNLKCIMCPQSLNQVGERGYMDLALFRNIIDQCARFGPLIQLYMGGESLLHKNIIEMIRIIKEKGLKVLLATNATRMDAAMSRNLLASGLDYLVFSFDGWDEASYESIRVGARFRETEDRIETFLRLKEEAGRKTPRVTLYSLGLNPDKSSEEERAALKAFHRRFHRPGVEDLMVGEAGNWAGRFAQTRRFRVRTPGPRYAPCARIWKDMAIRWDGKVVPCCADLRGDQVVGEAGRTPLVEIWNGEALCHLREIMVQGRHREVPLCRECDEPYPPEGALRWGLPRDYIPGPLLRRLK